MQFIKNFFNHDNTIVGLSGLKKQKAYVEITIPQRIKKTYLTNTTNNYLLY